MFDDLRADLRRHFDGQSLAWWQKLLLIVETQGVWTVCTYRFGRWVYTRSPTLIRPPLKVAYHVAQKVTEITTGMRVPASCDIGPGFAIGHLGTVVIHHQTRMGRNCSVGHDVTIGTVGPRRPGVPVLGDGVTLHTGCRVLGPIHIGDRAEVGANAVVLEDVPPDTVVVGVPARPVRRRAEVRVVAPKRVTRRRRATRRR